MRNIANSETELYCLWLVVFCVTVISHETFLKVFKVIESHARKTIEMYYHLFYVLALMLCIEYLLWISKFLYSKNLLSMPLYIVILFVIVRREHINHYLQVFLPVPLEYFCHFYRVLVSKTKLATFLQCRDYSIVLFSPFLAYPDQREGFCNLF